MRIKVFLLSLSLNIDLGFIGKEIGEPNNHFRPCVVDTKGDQELKTSDATTVDDCYLRLPPTRILTQL